jgi:hypothetical protein
MAAKQTPRRQTGGQQTGAGSGTSAPTVPPRRCTYLHPTHLTGCREPAEPGELLCAAHRPDGTA